jgi:aquaporin Z
MSLQRRAVAEAFGTFWLVLGGCGSAVLAANLPDLGGGHLGIGFAGVALAFGLTLLTMVYTIGPISGCHINPAVTVGLWAARRFPGSDVIAYVVAQVVGAIVAAGILYLIASGKTGFTVGGFATNGYGSLSPGGYGLVAVAIDEIVLTFAFVTIILGSTDKRAPAGFAGIAIGLSLTLIHLISIPVDNTSVNPARSLGPAIFAGSAALGQLWLFWVAPLVGGMLAGFAYGPMFGAKNE